MVVRLWGFYVVSSVVLPSYHFYIYIFNSQTPHHQRFTPLAYVGTYTYFTASVNVILINICLVDIILAMYTNTDLSIWWAGLMRCIYLPTKLILTGTCLISIYNIHSLARKTTLYTGILAPLRYIPPLLYSTLLYSTLLYSTLLYGRYTENKPCRVK